MGLDAGASARRGGQPIEDPVAEHLAAGAVLVFLGEDPIRLMAGARAWLAQQVTLKTEVDPDVRHRLTGEHPAAGE